MKQMYYTIAELHDAYVKRETTPLAIVKAVIEALKKDENNILEAPVFEEALAFAATLTKVEEDNLLWGVPFLVKDNFSTKGTPTTGASNILNGYVPLFDATVVAKLKALKAIPVAKSTLDELGMGGRGVSSHLGITYNPYGEAKTRIVGGSSSGSASGVASGYTPFALGSDTGDSIRKPASYAGLVGFKPTWGEISRYGLFSFMPALDAVGFFSRSVADIKTLFSATRGYDHKDFTSVREEEFARPEVKLDVPLTGVKLAIIKPIYDLMKDKDLRKAFDELVNSLAKRGAIVEEVGFDQKLLNAILPTYAILSSAEASASNANLSGINFGATAGAGSYEAIVYQTREDGFSSPIKNRLIMGNFALKKENKQMYFLRAQKARRLMVDALNDIFKDYDAILLPAAPSVAPLVNEYAGKDMEIPNNYLALANFGGNPSLTVPLTKIDGLPIGVNLTGPIFSDNRIFNIGYHIEQITGLYNLYKGAKL